MFSRLLLLCCVKCDDELQILLYLRSAFNESSSTALDSWKATAGSVCSFEGITCNAEESVKEIELSNQNLIGALPLNLICQLQSLDMLSLRYNLLENFIGEELSNCVKLQYLDLGNNVFEGPFPDQILELKKLDFLDLGQWFIWKIPVELGKLHKLRRLQLYDNRLQGKIPVGLRNLTKLEYLDVSRNQLEGDISLLRYLSNMVSLQLTANLFTGIVPTGIWGLPKMVTIDVTYNQFEGELPEEISEATSLEIIERCCNQFSGKIPHGIGELKRLSSLELQYNRLSGSIPESLSSCRKIPREIGELKGLSSLELQENGLSGSIPSSLGSSPLLDILDLSQNELSGKIPTSLSSHSWRVLYLSNNRLSAPERNFEGNPGLCSSIIKSFRQCPPDSGMSKDVRTLITCLALRGATILLASPGCFLYLKRKKDHGPCLKEKSWAVKSFHRLILTENEILDSLQQQNLIGRGGSGNVYKATLSNGLDLAVKHIWLTDSHASRRSQNSKPIQSKRDSKAKEFDTEVRTLSSIRHVNVVKLYCSMTSQEAQDSSLLVYEYLPNGSLWDRRLFDRFCWLIKLMVNSVEYCYTYKVNEKSDVYSFGVVLMELVIGKRPTEPEFGDDKDIVTWVLSKTKDKASVLSIIDPRIADASKEYATKVLEMAIFCTNTLAALRPTMRTVVQMLKRQNRANWSPLLSVRTE
ncbi:hypothetical protein ES332_A05G289800v1 [Gossypium tomentosum]|uniref:Protein kinase domain-containing protein n=1 Tax=Gossypium tomentosum TaxID=34277 RepID=A0A5D2QNY0_GOSTO|nr:hypothetical protein ES332_A05G289800v1 [Gossypium tomentosum]